MDNFFNGVRNVLFLWLLLVCAGCDDSPAQNTQLTATDYLDWCGDAEKGNDSLRQTILVIDQATPYAGIKPFNLYLIENIKLMPRERVDLFLLNAYQGTLQKMASFCYPGYSVDEKKQKLEELRTSFFKKASGYLLDDNGIGNIPGIIKDFEQSYFKPLLEPVIQAQKNSQGGNDKPKNLLYALANNIPVLVNRAKINRVILYSDLLQDMQDPNLTKTLGNDSHFQGTTFYVFGRGSSLPANNPKYEEMDKFWRNYLAAHYANLESGWFADNLKQENDMEGLTQSKWRGNLKPRKGGEAHPESIPVSVRVAQDDHGRLVYSGLFINAAPSDKNNPVRVKGFVPLDSAQPPCGNVGCLALVTKFFQHDDLLTGSRLELLGVGSDSVTGTLTAKTKKNDVVYDVALSPIKEDRISEAK